MALSHDSGTQDDIALAIFSQPYTNLTTDQKSAIDGGSTSANSGVVNAALDDLNRYANLVTGDDLSTIPDEWRGLLVAESTSRLAINWRSDRVREFRIERDEALRTAITTYSRAIVDDSTATEGLVVDRLNIKRHVLAISVNQNPPLMPRAEVVDACLRRSIIELWEMGDWAWLRYEDTVTIPEAGGMDAPSVTYASSKVPDRLLSPRVWYDDGSGVGSSIRNVTANEMAHLRARTLAVGRPQFMRVFRTSAGALTWHFERDTDQEYTVRAEFKERLPSLVNETGVSAAISAMPEDFQNDLLELTTALVLNEHGKREGFVRAQAVRDKLTSLETKDDTGQHDAERSQSMVRDTFYEQAANSSLQGEGFMLGGLS